MKFSPEYVRLVLNENFEDAKAQFLSPLMSIHYAHLVMLAEQRIIPAEEARAIRKALDSIDLAAVRAVRYDGTYEDLFFYLDRLIGDCCGQDAAGRLHTARSRNDIDMTMYRMHHRELLLAIVERTLQLRRVLLALAENYRDAVFAAHTHTQPAQPSTIAHYLLAAIEQLERDTVRLKAAYTSTNQNPLGACAITGTGFPIDRNRTAELLGFDRSTCWRVSARQRSSSSAWDASFKICSSGVRASSAICVCRTASSSAAASCRRSAIRSRSNMPAPSPARRSDRRPDSCSPSTTRPSATLSIPKTTCSRSSGRCSGTPRVRSGS
jgi:argininosuccinate lyase